MGGKVGGERSFHDGVPDPGRISTREEFAAALTSLRERAGLTVRDVARRLGAPTATVGDYFSGRHLPPLRPPEQLARILSACGVDDAAEIQEWLDALGRVRRAPGRRPAGAPVPYRGLKSFQPEDAEWFYGRRRLTDALLENLRDCYQRGGLLAVAGPSGSGKSSLLRAGLIPELRSGALGIPGSADWPLILITPGAWPARELAWRLAGVAGDAPGGRVVIVVDQFEQIFTSCDDESERVAFIRELRAAADRDGGREPAALVVIGFRADFYPHALRYPGLVSALQERQVLVGPMTEAELRSAITGPARQAGLDIEDGLTEILLRDAGALPLLSHALLATWERSRGGRLTVADYRDTGGISGAVAASAEEVFAGLTSGQRELARRIFTRLVHVADAAGGTRRRVPRTELLQLDAGAQVVLDAFIEKRLITAGAENVEIAHEALLHAWPRLRQWIDSDSISVRTHRHLTTAAELWRDAGRDPSALLSGGLLAGAEEWAALPAHGDDLNALEREFLDAGVRQRLAAERSARRQTRLLRGFTGALAALFLVAGTLAVIAYQQKNTAAGQRDVAISRQLATDADQLRTTDPALAMQLALAGYRVSPTAEAVSSLLDATADPPATRMLGPAGTEMLSVALSRDGALLAAGSDNGTVRLWSLARPGHPLLLAAPMRMAGPVSSLTFSPNGSVLAISAGGAVALWNVSDPRRPALAATIPAARGVTLNTVAYSPDGQTLATADAHGDVYLWDTADPRHPAPRGAPLEAGAGQVNAVGFSPDGGILAAGGANGHVRLWFLANDDARPAAIAVLNGPANGINAIAFSPDSRTLAAAGNDSRVWLWTLADDGRADSARPSLTGARSWIYALAFSPAGNAVAAGSADDNTYVWSLPGGVLTSTLPHPAPVTAVAYGPGGDTLATGDADDVAQLWTLPGPVLAGPAGSSIFTVAFNPDADILAAGSAPPSGQGAVQLWDPATHDRPAPLGPRLTAPGGLDGTVAYGPGGRLAAGGDKGGVLLWDVRDPRHPVPLPTPATALDSAIQYVAFDKTGRYLAAGSTDGTVEVWDTADPARTTPVAVFPADTTGPAADRDVFAVAFSHDDRLLATAATDGTVRLWDISDPARPRELGQPLTRLADAVYQVTFSPDGQVLAASGEDGDVRLWDVTQPSRPRLLSVLSGPVGIVYDVAFSPDGRTLATADGDKTIALWNVADPAAPVKIGSLTGPAGTVFSVAFSPDGATLAAGSQDDTTRLWVAAPAAAAAYACAVVGDPMTRAEWAQYIPELPYDPPCAAS
jgi:WD40 repeat protein/transcriptional regulator with XRE-family HTH domain